MNDDQARSADDVIPAGDTDPYRWARCFARRAEEYPGLLQDEAELSAWFSLAILTGRGNAAEDADCRIQALYRKMMWNRCILLTDGVLLAAAVVLTVLRLILAAR